MRRPSPALILSIAALVVALGGTAVAAKKYVVTSTKQISPKVLSQLRGRTGPVGADGIQGPRGTDGAPGAPGSDGPPGPSDVVFGARDGARNVTGSVLGKLTLDKGSWLVVASLVASTAPDTSGTLACSLLGGDANPPSSETDVSPKATQLTVSKAVTLATPTDIQLQCLVPAATTSAKLVRMYAIRTAAVTKPSLD